MRALIVTAVAGALALGAAAPAAAAPALVLPLLVAAVVRVRRRPVVGGRGVRPLVTWHAGRVNEAARQVGGTVRSVDELVPEWLTVPDVAERFGVLVTKVHQHLNDGALAGIRRDGVLRIPAGFLAGDTIVKGLPGVLNVLHDGGYDDEAAIRWLHTPDDSLPGTPVDALHADRRREVTRRAQALAF